jgi:hypothetical protein
MKIYFMQQTSRLIIDKRKINKQTHPHPLHLHLFFGANHTMNEHGRDEFF